MHLYIGLIDDNGSILVSTTSMHLEQQTRNGFRDDHHNLMQFIITAILCALCLFTVYVAFCLTDKRVSVTLHFALFWRVIPQPYATLATTEAQSSVGVLVIVVGPKRDMLMVIHYVTI